MIEQMAKKNQLIFYSVAYTICVSLQYWGWYNKNHESFPLSIANDFAYNVTVTLNFNNTYFRRCSGLLFMDMYNDFRDCPSTGCIKDSFIEGEDYLKRVYEKISSDRIALLLKSENILKFSRAVYAMFVAGQVIINVAVYLESDDNPGSAQICSAIINSIIAILICTFMWVALSPIKMTGYPTDGLTCKSAYYTSGCPSSITATYENTDYRYWFPFMMTGFLGLLIYLCFIAVSLCLVCYIARLTKVKG